jgi:hypothetical protein
MSKIGKAVQQEQEQAMEDGSWQEQPDTFQEQPVETKESE